MLNRTVIKTTTICATLLLVGAAQASHWDRPSCYIDVHSGCYVNTNSPCTDEDYQGFLDNCDVAYPAAKRNPGLGLVAPPKPAALGLTLR